MLVYARNVDSGLGPELPSGAQVEATVTALRMLADPTRLRLMWLLRDSAGESDVGSLALAVGAARPRGLPASGEAAAGRPGVDPPGRPAGCSTGRGGGHVRRLVTEAVQAGDHLVTGEPDHD